MIKFHIYIYGCQMNYSDSARIKSVLQNSGMIHTDKVEDANIVIFDTCSVRQKSEDKIWGILKEIPKDKKIWITGCMVGHNLKLKKLNNKDEKMKHVDKGNFLQAIKTKDPEVLGLERMDNVKIDETKEYVMINYCFDPLFHKMNMAFPNLELFFRIDDLGFLPKILLSLGYYVKPDIEVTNEYTGIASQGANMNFSETSKTAFIPIQTGCSQFCSYCIVPYARGTEKNRSVDEVLSEIQKLVNQGAEEITLLGQIVNKHTEFTKILKETLKIKGIKWLRYTSPYPTYYNDEILAMHESEEILCPHIHAPVQAGSDTVLKKMFRGYTSDQYKQFIDSIRNLKRPISITSDVIVGFSDETDEDFAKTLELVEYSKFDMIYMGIYSPRPGTYGANKYQDNVPTEIKKQRWGLLNTMLNKISLENNQSELGQIKTVMVMSIDGLKAIGYTENMKHISFKVNENTKVGNFEKVKVTKVIALKLEGEIVS